MLASAAVAFAKAGPELRALAIQAIRTHPQPPFNRPAYTTGRTAQQIAETHGDDFVELTGPLHIKTLIFGRGPTVNGNSGGEKLSEILAQWARNKPGFVLRPGSTYEQFGIVAAIKMHREGSALYQLDKPSGLFDEILSPAYLDLLKARIAAGEMVAITTALTQVLR